MDIRFRSKKLEKVCCQKSRRIKGYGAECGKKLGQRLDELRAASNLGYIRTLPMARCHELKAKRKGQFSVDLKHPLRLIFEPDHDPVPTKPDGGIDWSSVTSITIIEIEDTHG